MIPLDQFFDEVRSLRGEDLSSEDAEKIGQAFTLAEHYHTGQVRANGQPYFFEHCVPVAYKVASLELSSTLIAAALLHDALEDTELTYEELHKTCGQEIADLVDGVSKLSKVKYRGSDRHIESLRKFFIATAKDLRVVILKLCDRWHNLETLSYLPEEKRQRIARESILVHAQLASRLNMGQLASTIKDLAFPYAYPEEYEKTKQAIGEVLAKADDVIGEVQQILVPLLNDSLGYTPLVDKRVKGLYSTYEKLCRKSWRVEEIYDLIAIRVIVNEVEECYRVIGIIHGLWRSLPGRFKDYISIAKPNGYRSLHTVITTTSGIPVEVQVRTYAMHTFNEYGVASHHSYKTRSTGAEKPTFEWLTQLSKLDNQTSPEEYLHLLKTDFFERRIFALTPAGDVVDLPAGATVLDFAYAIHSDVGERALAGKINGNHTRLESVIESESTVEIITSPKSKPTKRWLDIVVTSQARSKIKKYLNEHELTTY